MTALSEIHNWSPKCLEYIDMYWSTSTNRTHNQHLHNTCYKGMQEMFLTLITGKFDAMDRDKYQTRILKKLGYVLGTPESKKVRNYINDVAKNERLSAHLVFLSCNLLHNSTVAVLDTSKHANVNVLKDVWMQLDLMKTSKYHAEHYYQIRARNKKLKSVLSLCTAKNFQLEGLKIKQEGVKNYLDSNLDAVIQDTEISLEAMILTGYIIRVLTTTFKMNMVTSEKYLTNFCNAIIQGRMNYITEEKNYLDHQITTYNPERSCMSLHVPIYNILYGCLELIVNSDFIQEVKQSKLNKHKK